MDCSKPTPQGTRCAGAMKARRVLACAPCSGALERRFPRPMDICLGHEESKSVATSAWDTELMQEELQGHCLLLRVDHSSILHYIWFGDGFPSIWSTIDRWMRGSHSHPVISHYSSVIAVCMQHEHGIVWSKCCLLLAANHCLGYMSLKSMCLVHQQAYARE